ncbi:MAG TPA: glycosyltransferase family 2 protein [Candidatus Binataceae bacterium]|nr:glycosyltransferase family 2 protein [Candidatus Binataceae bacterium]
MDSVSVIIAVFDRARTLQACLDSIFAQTAQPLELIVCDGGSTDGSREIIAANSARLSYWQSQKDRGVAHAWNMALEHASGDWISFLGADDRFAESTSIAKMLDAAAPDSAINYVSGQAALIGDDGQAQRIIGERWDWERMKRYQHIAHPGSLHRRDLFTRYGNFDERLAIAFDYDFLLRAGRDIRAAFLAEPVTMMGAAGQSNAQAWRAFRENRRIQRAHPEIGARAAAINHAIAAAKQVARATLRRA